MGRERLQQRSARFACTNNETVALVHLWWLSKLFPRRLHHDKVELHRVNSELHAAGIVLQRACQEGLSQRRERIAVVHATFTDTHQTHISQQRVRATESCVQVKGGS